MKIRTTISNHNIVVKFMGSWIPEKPNNVQEKYLKVWGLEECEPLYLDCDAAELANALQVIEEKGFVNTIKAIFQGDHFYRSDTGQCPRCYRYRPEIHWNNENIPDSKNAELCDRCSGCINGKTVR